MNALRRMTSPPRCLILASAIALAIGHTAAFAQEVDHSKMQMPPAATPPVEDPPPAKKKPAAKKPATAPAVDPHAGHVMPAPAKKPTPASAPAAAPKKPATSPPAVPRKSAAPAVDPHAGHVMPMPTKKPAAAPPAGAAAPKKPAAASTAATPDPHAGHVMPAPAKRPASTPRTPPPPKKKSPPAASPPVDHAAMGHGDPAKAAPSKPADPTMDHSGMETPTGDQPAMDHSGMEMPTGDQPAMDHSGMEMPTSGQPAMDHSAMGHEMPAATDAPRTPIPPLTDADRQAAFPPVDGHAAHDRKSHTYWLVDHLEAWDADNGTGLGWEGLAWVGGDLRRLWLRSEGEAVDGDIESADIEVLAGRSIAPWWDMVAGVRHDFGEGPSQTFLAVGAMGLSPYKFEVAATGYLGQGGQTTARVEGEYDTLLTNRLILQWRAEANLYGKDDAERGIGSGLGTVEAGVRLRFEVTRKFAPYVGVVWERAYGGTADLRRAAGDDIHDTRVVAGIRFWF